MINIFYMNRRLALMGKNDFEEKSRLAGSKQGGGEKP